MQLRWRITVVVVGIALAGCVPAPTIAPLPTPTSGPTVVPAVSPTAAATPAPLAIAVLRELPEAPSGTLGYGPVQATPTGFVVTGTVDQFTPVVWYGDPSATTWQLFDASDLGGPISEFVAGPTGDLLGTDLVDRVGMRLWSSTDGLTWRRFPQPDGFEQADAVHLAAGLHGFTASAEVGGVTTTYASADGRSWSLSSKAAKPDPQDFGQTVVPLADGRLLAVGASASGDTTAELSSGDGTWTAIHAAGAPPPNVVLAAHASGDGLIVVGSVEPDGSGGPITSWYGTLEGTGPDTSITWADITPGGGYGSDLAGVGLSDAAGTILSSDATTHLPISWTTTASAHWVRHELPASTFGEGVPSSVAQLGGTAAALGWKVNAVGEWVRRPWRSVDGGPWTEVATDLFGVLPHESTSSCPPVGLHEIASYLAIRAQLRPLCFGHRTLQIRGYAADCGGCGGTGPDNPNPEWLQHTLHIWPLYLQPTAPGDIPVEDRLGVSINPAHPVTIPPIGSFVEVTGHFDDPAASTCTNWPIPGFGAGYSPRSILVATCREEFVIDGVEVLAN